LSKRIVHQTNPLSLYASSPVGDWTKKELDYDRSKTQRGNRLVILFNIKPSMRHRTLAKKHKAASTNIPCFVNLNKRKGFEKY
jgi:hypothetical protein